MEEADTAEDRTASEAAEEEVGTSFTISIKISVLVMSGGVVRSTSSSTQNLRRIVAAVLRVQEVCQVVQSIIQVTASMHWRQELAHSDSPQCLLELYRCWDRVPQTNG